MKSDIRAQRARQARAAYQLYKDLADPKLPTWGSLTDAQRTKWVDAVIAAHGGDPTIKVEVYVDYPSDRRRAR